MEHNWNVGAFTQQLGPNGPRSWAGSGAKEAADWKTSMDNSDEKDNIQKKNKKKIQWQIKKENDLKATRIFWHVVHILIQLTGWQHSHVNILEGAIHWLKCFTSSSAYLWFQSWGKSPCFDLISHMVVVDLSPGCLYVWSQGSAELIWVSEGWLQHVVTWFTHWHRAWCSPALT